MSGERSGSSYILTVLIVLRIGLDPMFIRRACEKDIHVSHLTCEALSLYSEFTSIMPTRRSTTTSRANNRRQLFRKSKSIANEIGDLAIRARTLAGIASSEADAGFDGATTLAQAKAAAQTHGDPQCRAYAFCAIALAEAKSGREYKTTIRAAQDSRYLNTEDSVVARIRVALTEAKIERGQGYLMTAKTLVRQLSKQNDRDKAYDGIARTEAELGRPSDAALTLEQIESPIAYVQACCEVALCASERHTDPSHFLAAVNQRVPQIPSHDERVEAACHLAVALALLGGDAECILQAVREAATEIQDSEGSAAAQCQLASAEAQMGRLDAAKFRTAGIPLTVYRDSAYQTIASEEARNRRFEEAMTTVAMIEKAEFRNGAHSAIALAMARTAADTLKGTDAAKSGHLR